MKSTSNGPSKSKKSDCFSKWSPKNLFVELYLFCD